MTNPLHRTGKTMRKLLPSRLFATRGVLFLLALVLAACTDQPTGPGTDPNIADIRVTANVSGTTISTLVVQVTAPDISTPLVFNLQVQDGIATGTIKVKAKVDDGALEVEGEVDTNRVGQTWNWRIVRNGTIAAKRSKVTAAPSGSFSVNRRIANPAGQDTIKFRAVRPATGTVCSVSVQV